MSNVYDAGFGPQTPESWLSRYTPYILLLAYLYHCTQVTIEIFDEFFYFYRVLPLVESAILWLFAAAGVGVVIRVITYAVGRVSWTTIVRRILGEPTWWRTWYPHFLRDSASVWDKLPATLKVMRNTVVGTPGSDCLPWSPSTHLFRSIRTFGGIPTRVCYSKTEFRASNSARHAFHSTLRRTTRDVPRSP